MNTLKFGDFPKRLRLCEGKFTKSSKTPWSKRDSGKREKYITCLSKIVNIVAGGETKECLEAFARGKRAKKFIAPVDDTPLLYMAHYEAQEHSHEPAGAASDQASTYYGESLSAANPEVAVAATVPQAGSLAYLWGQSKKV